MTKLQSKHGYSSPEVMLVDAETSSLLCNSTGVGATGVSEDFITDKDFEWDTL